MTEPTIVPVPLPGREYEIAIGVEPPDYAGWFDRAFAKPPTSLLIVHDEAVAGFAAAVGQTLSAAGHRIESFAVPSGEASKSVSQFHRSLDAVAATKADRRAAVVAVGGGVVGDLAGYVAASYLRGVDFVQVPTTLLAAVDSSVGGKTGINLEAGKNLVGAFHQPRLVLVSPSHFATLPDRDWLAGLAEVIKYGVILDADFFAFMEGHVDELRSRAPETVRRIIRRSCELKAHVVLEDERETTGLRAVLNYGHTFAHAYENLLGYGTLLHGEAVAIGMLHASDLAERLGRIDAEATRRQRDLIAALGLPTRLPTPLPVDAVIDVMRSDKKAEAGRLRFILPTRIGHVELVDDVPEETVRECLAAVLQSGT